MQIRLLLQVFIFIYYYFLFYLLTFIHYYQASNCHNFTGDTFLRAIVNGIERTYNDDSCGQGSTMTFQMLRDETVVIQEGCFSSVSCSGTVVLTFSNLIGSSLGTVPLLSNPVNYATRRPTKSPTLSPTATPTSPTSAPTFAPTVKVP